MRTTSGNLHLEIQTSRKSPVGLLRTTYWDRDAKKYAHTQHGRITGCELEQLQLLQLAFREKVVPSDSPEAFTILRSRELGASQAILELARGLGLHRVLYSRNEPWVESVMAMIVGRIVYQGSKLSLCNQWQNTRLWELCGIEGRPDVEEHCYRPMDELLKRQKAIQKKLAAKHLEKQSLDTIVLYDITSTYFEGEYEDSDIVRYGYNRDRKKGTKQVVIGLICNGEGCPVGCEIFQGNTNDASTVEDKIKELKNLYGIEQCIFVGDRGMLTSARLTTIDQDETLSTITALTHSQLQKLLRQDTIQLELFDENNIVEVLDPEDPKLRYCLCKNPVSAKKQTATRRRLLELTAEGLALIANYKQSTTAEKLAARVGRVLEKYKMAKFINWHITPAGDKASSRDHQLHWTLDEAKIARESRLDGCYIIRATVSKEVMDTQNVVRTYKSLGEVERAFRNLKTAMLEMRPVYHKKDERIRAHVFLCMLAYYVQWHMHKALAPLCQSDGEGGERAWSFQGVIDTLKAITCNDVRMNNIEFQQNAQPTLEQTKILELLKTAI